MLIWTSLQLEKPHHAIYNGINKLLYSVRCVRKLRRNGDYMKIAIVDDENFFLEYLDQAMKDRLSKIGISIEQLDLFHSADEFFAEWTPGKYHVIILDIFIDQDNGVEISRKIREKDDDVSLVFCSTSNEFAAQSYEVDASYYMQKPLSEEKISAMLKRVNFARLERNQLITLPDGFRCLLHKIQYTNYMNHCIVFYFEGAEPHSIYMSHADAEALLLPHGEFVTINKGNIVNMEMVAQISKNTFHMKNGELLPISRRRFKDISLAYAQFQLKKMEFDL